MDRCGRVEVSVMRNTGLLGLSILIAAALLTASPAQAQECGADVSVSLARSEADQESMLYQFEVEISSGESCAEIHYDLILDVQLPNGHVKRVRKPRVVKLSDSALNEVVRHEVPIDQKVTGQEARLVECKPCDLGA
jgi:hypothetical protein